MHVPSDHSILVVDDVKSNRHLYAKVLSHAGYSVTTASDGAAALDALEQGLPTLLVLDYMMPGMDGAEVLRRLRARLPTRELPVIVLTASVNEEDIENALNAGADDYITKPVDSRILLTRIRSIIQARKDRAAASAKPERDALRRELDEAQSVQRAQLPPVPVTKSGWALNGCVVPSGQIAGDVFDYVVTKDQRTITYLIDVSGHGTASALVAAETRTGLRELVSERPIEEAVAQLNQRMVQRETGKYACLAVIDALENEVSIVNAGLPPVLVITEHAVHRVVGSGLPPGMFPNAQYQPTRFSLSRGDQVLVVSDGLTEPFGNADDVEGVLARLGADPSGMPISQCRRLESLVTRCLTDRSDDATLLIMERLV